MSKRHQKKLSIMGTMDYPKMGPEYELARAYVPIQMYTQQYSPEDGLKRGTIFPELYRPYPPCPMMEEHCKD